jgi:Lrp/AsnC family transcriptional regulator, leucine-responsive regulatory protein
VTNGPRSYGFADSASSAAGRPAHKCRGRRGGGTLGLALFAPIKKLEETNVIRGYRVIIDRDAVGLGLTVIVEIKVGRHSKENASVLQAALVAIPEVVACHMISGAADFIAEVVVKDLKAYEQLLTDKLLVLDMIEDIRSNFSLRRIKSDAPLPLPVENPNA